MDIKTMVKNTIAPAEESLRDRWVEHALTAIPKGQSIIDLGAGEMPYKPFCRNLKYISQDFGKYSGKNRDCGIQSGQYDTKHVDIVSDITHVPVPDGGYENVLCTEVFEHIPDPLKALTEINRITKKGGTLILSAPWASLTHFYPYFYYSGFSQNFYRKNLPEYGFKIREMYVYGDYFDWLCLEFVRLPLMVFKYNKILAVLLLPFMLLAAPWYVFIRICGKCFPQSSDTLAWGVGVIATKTKTIRH